jgi:streptogramin lyase
LDQPAAFTTSGNDVWVADEGNNSVTELDVSTGQLVRVISAQGLSSPDGIAAGSGMVWVANNASSSVTQISGSTGAVLATKTDQDGSYGFWNPTAMISTGYSIYTMTPYGTSPMVTKMSASTGHPYWFMCNTNGPYYFSELSAFAISNGDLWVASRSGANSKTPGAATGSLTELSLGSGQLIKTLPSH